MLEVSYQVSLVARPDEDIGLPSVTSNKLAVPYGDEVLAEAVYRIDDEGNPPLYEVDALALVPVRAPHLFKEDVSIHRHDPTDLAQVHQRAIRKKIELIWLERVGIEDDSQLCLTHHAPPFRES